MVFDPLWNRPSKSPLGLSWILVKRGHFRPPKSDQKWTKSGPPILDPLTRGYPQITQTHFGFLDEKNDRFWTFPRQPKKCSFWPFLVFLAFLSFFRHFWPLSRDFLGLKCYFWTPFWPIFGPPGGVQKWPILGHFWHFWHFLKSVIFGVIFDTPLKWPFSTLRLVYWGFESKRGHFRPQKVTKKGPILDPRFWTPWQGGTPKSHKLILASWTRKNIDFGHFPDSPKSGHFGHFCGFCDFWSFLVILDSHLSRFYI